MPERGRRRPWVWRRGGRGARRRRRRSRSASGWTSCAGSASARARAAAGQFESQSSSCNEQGVQHLGYVWVFVQLIDGLRISCKKTNIALPNLRLPTTSGNEWSVLVRVAKSDIGLGGNFVRAKGKDGAWRSSRLARSYSTCNALHVTRWDMKQTYHCPCIPLRIQKKEIHDPIGYMSSTGCVSDLRRGEHHAARWLRWVWESLYATLPWGAGYTVEKSPLSEFFNPLHLPDLRAYKISC